MLIEKLQMLALAMVSNEDKVSWLIQWNESSVLNEAINFPKQGFSNFMFDRWLHKATF
jgi:hypothetical protein